MKSLFVGALALTSLMSGAAIADTVNIDFFTVPDFQDNGAALPDFGVCCTSPPATVPNIAIGSSLSGGLPVTTTGGPTDVKMVSGTGQILWWTPSGTTVVATGSSIVNLPYTNNNFYAPMGNGPTNIGNSNFFQTAIVSGILTGSGSDAKLTLTSDDDAFVYVNGLYIGGNPGVHGAQTSILDLGSFTGTESLEIFYADRAQTQAVLGITLDGATVTASVPEPSTWAMMILGFFGVGFMAYRRKSAPRLRIA